MPVIPQIITEDRASGAQFIDGSLKFGGGRSSSSATDYLNRTFSTPTSGTKWTYSIWVKRSKAPVTTGHQLAHLLATAGSGAQGFIGFSWNVDGEIGFGFGGYARRYSAGLLRDFSAWYHIVIVVDTSQGIEQDRAKLYLNGIKQVWTTNTAITQDSTTQINQAVSHLIGGQTGQPYESFDGYMSQVYFIDGQALDASYFGFTDPLTNTWRPKKYTGTFTGTNSFYLPLDGNSPIGEDKSGNGNNWTPSGFGGSNSIEKATGALPILNTVGGGVVASAFPRPDEYASSLVLAQPFAYTAAVQDISYQINSGSTQKTVTLSGNTAGGYNTGSPFYNSSLIFDGSGDYMDIGGSSDFNIGTGDFTIEFWMFSGTNSLDTFYRRLWMTDGPTGNAVNNFQIAIVPTSGVINLWDNGTLDLVGTTNVTNSKWHHIAAVRSGTTLKIFVDGVMEASTTFSGAVSPNSGTPRPRIGSYDGTNGDYNGYLNDLRVYVGVAKYSNNFVPASSNPDILPDTPSGVAYGSELKQITEGSVNGGVSNGDTLLVGNSSDFSFGSGDFTVELFAYHTSTAGNDTLVGVWNSGSNRRSWMIDIEADQGRLRGYWSTDGSNNSAVQTVTGYISRRKWNHIVFCRQGNTMRLYLNGNQEATATESGSLYNNVNDSLGILSATDAGNDPCRGHISNVRIIKGTCLYPDGTSFTPPSAPLTNVTNTVLLACQSPTSATAYEVSPGAITTSGSVSASAFNPFTDDINTVRGQENAYCILNSAATFNGDGGDIQDGGLKFECPASGDASTRGTIPIPAGSKFYMEAKYKVAAGASGQARLGIAQVQQGYTKSGTGMWSIDFRGSAGTIQKDDQGSLTTLTGNPDNNDVVGIKIDLATGEFRAHHRGIYYNSGNALMTGIPNVESYFFAALDGGINRNDWEEVNFGQKPWKYPPGDGYQPLCSANLPKPTLPAAVRPDKYFNTVLYNGTSVTNNVTGVGFQPDFVWIKKRNAAEQHELQDSVRGATKRLASNLLASETTVAGSINSFDNDGFTVVDAGSTNENTFTYVGWAWKAGGNSGTFNIDGRGYATAAEAGLTAGTKASLLTGASVNTESGFSILTWTGDGAESNLSIPHGLSSIPKMVVIKKRNEAVDDWYVAHYGIEGYNYAYRMFWGPTNGTALPSGSQATTNPYYLGSQSSNDTLLLNNTTTYGGANENNITYVAYCWSEVPGFSKMGTYTGNGAVNGPLIECGFKPAWVMVKVAGGSTGNSWSVWDNKRDPVNEMNLYLHPNEAQQDGSYSAMKMDFYSTGFKPRGDIVHQNSSGVKYIYTAFADVPTVNLYGGQANAR